MWSAKGLNIFKYFRLIDNLCTCNKYEFENSHNVYPDKMELENGNKDPYKD